jgi:LysM repeat protein
MLSPREQGGGLAEASRLLQEGLRLLDERRREVDALLEGARERALDINAKAEQHAQQITADAERQRAELEEQVAALRSEVASLRAELTSLQSSKSEAAPVPVEAAAATAQLEASEVAEAAEAAGTPRWGRRSNVGAAQQALRASRSARPRWLPPWVPFLLILLLLLGAGAVVATSVDGQSGSRSVPTEAPANTIAPAGANLAPTSDADLTLASVASVTSGATVLVAAAQAFATAMPSPAQPTPTSAAAATSASPAPTTPTASVVRQALTLPPSGARLGTPLVVPGEAGPEGPILAAYTMYATYTVRPGDTLNKVASQFGVTGETIVRTSGLADPNLLQPGQVLTIPRDSGWLYRAQPGDTLEIIASRFGLSVDDLLAVGDLVFIPDRGLSTLPKR